MSKADEIYLQLKRRIITGAYEAMSDLNEALIAEEFAVSRTPVREAVLRLKTDGYLSVVPNKGTFVRPVSHSLIEEIYAMRFLNEPYICKQAAILMPRQKLLEIKEKLESKPASPEAEPDNPNADARAYFIELDSALHTQILSYCGNSFLIAAMTNVYDHNERIRHFASDPGHDNSVAEHIRIVDAMLSQDPDAIDKAVTDHIRASKTISENCFKQQPFYEY